MARNNKEIILGNKYPIEYFFTKGHGESDYGGKGIPFEAGSYDSALNMAGIEQANVMFYTSLLPPEAKEISKEKGLKTLKWGHVLDSIMAKMNGKKGETITSAVMVTRVEDNKGKFLGHFACEYGGYGSKEDAIDTLLHDVSEMVERRGWGKPLSVAKMHQKIKTTKNYSYKPAHVVLETMKVKKRYGTVLSAICFTKYSVPILNY